MRVMTPPRTSWSVSVGVLALGTFAMGTGSFVLNGLLPQLAAGLHVSQGAAGQTGTAFALSYGLAAPVLAIATARFARKPLMIAAMLIFVLANALSAVAPTLPLLLAARVLAGFGVALYTPTAYGVAAALAGDAGRGKAFAMVLGGLALGTVIGVPAGTAIGQQISWQATLGFVAVLGALALLALVFGLPRLALPPAVALADRLRLLANPRVLMIVLITTVVTIGGFVFYTYIATILRHTANVTGVLLTGALIAWGVGGAIGTFGSGWLIERIGDARTSIFAMIALAASLVALSVTSNPTLVIALLVLNGAACWGNTTPNNHRIAGLAPAFPAVVVSYNSSGIYLGQALGAAVGGVLLIAQVSAPAMCDTGAVIVAAAVVLNIASLRR